MLQYAKWILTIAITSQLTLQASKLLIISKIAEAITKSNKRKTSNLAASINEDQFYMFKSQSRSGLHTARALLSTKSYVRSIRSPQNSKPRGQWKPNFQFTAAKMSTSRSLGENIKELPCPGNRPVTMKIKLQEIILILIALTPSESRVTTKSAQLRI